MKTLFARLLLSLCLLSWPLLGLAQPAEPPSEPRDTPSDNAPMPPADEETPPPADSEPEPEPPMPPTQEEPAPPPASEPDSDALQPPAPEDAAPLEEPASNPEPLAPGTGAPIAWPSAIRTDTPTPDRPDRLAPKPAAAARTNSDGKNELRLNFRNAPLELVLDYLSEAAGFIIDLQTEVRGRVDVWSNQPLTQDEAVEVLNSVLKRNGYAAIRNGRTLTIVSRDEAKTRDIPVKAGNDPTSIPKSDQIVTQIIPVRFINAVQLIRDLQPLLPTQTTMTANEGGNSLVITDTQVNIRRMAEIVRALDTAISSTSAIRVYPLKYADAKALSTVVRELFQNQGASSQRGGAAQMQQFFRGMRGGPPGMPGGQGGSTATGGARVATPAVVATADERSNALVVSAPEEQMAVIEELVAKVDVDVEDVTELRVFRLKYADPQETADLLTSLFPDTTGNQTARGGQVQFGGRFGGMGGTRGGSASADSARLQKQTRVLAVPDLRTSSVVVSASSELIVQISSMIEALDSDPARKQKVFIYSVENTDPETVQQALQNLFPSQNYGNMRNTRSTTRQTGSQLNNRSSSTQNQNRSSRNTGSSLGGGSFGGQTGR